MKIIKKKIIKKSGMIIKKKEKFREEDNPLHKICVCCPNHWDPKISHPTMHMCISKVKGGIRGCSCCWVFENEVVPLIKSLNKTVRLQIKFDIPEHIPPNEDDTPRRLVWEKNERKIVEKPLRKKEKFLFSGFIKNNR